jgi:hypothetical protein
MEEGQYQSDPYSAMGSRLRDVEEKQNLLKDRILLIGNTLVDERTKTFSKIQELKKEVMSLKDDMSKIKSFVQRVSEQIDNSARKEDLMILQRQFDLFRK